MELPNRSPTPNPNKAEAARRLPTIHNVTVGLIHARDPPALGPPRAALHHVQLLLRALLPELVVDVPEPRPDAAPAAGAHVGVLLAQGAARRANLRGDGVAEAPELPHDGAQRQGRVRPRRPGARHRLERRRNRRHLLTTGRKAQSIGIIDQWKSQTGFCSLLKKLAPAGPNSA